MRSELVFACLDRVRNRYFLAKLAAKAARKLHRPNTRIPDTINDALLRLGQEAPKFNLIDSQEAPIRRRAA
jgi:hypothetical protein